MILACPSCARRYLFDEKALKEESSHVRCVMCGYTWKPSLDLASSSLQSSEKTEDFDTPFLFNSPVIEKKKLSPGILAFLITLTVLASLLLFASNALVAFWPPLSQFYQLFNKDVPPFSSLKLQNLDAHYATTGESPKLVITGTLVNPTSSAVNLPPLHVTVLTPCFSPENQNKCPTQKLKFKINEGKILGGEEVHFEIPNLDIPPTGSSAKIEF